VSLAREMAAAIVTEVAADPDLAREFANALAPHLNAAPSVLTVAAAAKRVGVSTKTVRRAIEAGVLDAEMIAGRWQTTPDAVDDWRGRGCPTSTTPRPQKARPRRPRITPRGLDAAAAILCAGRLDQ
jgi:excisionase family DNA binding protein